MKKNIRFFGLVLLVSSCFSGCYWSKKKTDQESNKKHAAIDAKSNGIPLAKSSTERKTFREDLGAYDSEDDEDNFALAAAEIKQIENDGVATRIAYQKSNEPLKKIYFDYDRDDIRKSEEPSINYDAKIIKDIDLANKTIVAEGHCDDRYVNREYNVALSENRARIAAKEIAKRTGIDQKLIKTIGYGSEKPAVLKPGQKEQLNRRVEFEVLTERLTA